MIFSIDELPYDQFAVMGLSRKDVLELPPRTFNALMHGERTSLIRFNNLQLKGMEEKVTIDAKLSLTRNDAGAVVMNFHPINQVAKNIFDLNEKEIKQLKKNEKNFVDKIITTPSGKIKEVMISLDQVTNEYVSIDKAQIKAPDAINNVQLTDKQKSDFIQGKNVSIGKDQYRLNPNSEIGLSNADSNDTRGLKDVRFKNRSYSVNELVLDLALIASGLGGIVLIEHLASLIFSPSRTTQQNLGDKKYWEAMNDASLELKELKAQQRNQLLAIEKISEVVSKHLAKFGVVDPDLDKLEQLKTNVSIPNTYSGKLLEHGHAPYEFKKDNKDSYFIKYLDKSNQEQVLWGVDLERAVKEAKIQINQSMEIQHLGQKRVTVDSPIMKDGKIVGSEPKEVMRNSWEIKEIKPLAPRI